MAVRTQAQLNNEIQVSLPDNVIGQITPSILRSFQQDVCDTMFSLNPLNPGTVGNWTAIQNFNAGLTVNAANTTWTYSSGTSGPNLVLYNGFTTTAGTSVGAGLLFNANNAAGTFHTAAFINGGYVDNTTGHEKELIDFEVYQGLTATNLIVTLACSDSAFWLAPGADDTCSLGLSNFKWTNLYSYALTIGSSGTFTVDSSGNLTTSGGYGSFGGSILCQSGLSIPAGGTADSGLRFSSTDKFGIFFGSSTPTLAAAQGSLYLRSDGTQNNRLYINTNGSTGWTAFATTS